MERLRIVRGGKGDDVLGGDGQSARGEFLPDRQILEILHSYLASIGVGAGLSNQAPAATAAAFINPNTANAKLSATKT